MSLHVGDLVRHSDVLSLGVGLVTQNLGAHCMVQWTYETDDDRLAPGPTLEVKSMLEVVSASR